ncbi:adenosylcobinamide-GDP ribazoletransferase [Planktotalea sp.]|uniref:adenosylcobinamide-GDP ribazoletransferase n=1 Tax=Planktotalea sp. TaxID=2029877 RepID=UPI003298D624
MFNDTNQSDKTGKTTLNTQNDLIRDPALALSLLTRLPIKIEETEYERAAQAAWAYPVVGIVTGTLACISAGVALMLGLPLWCAAIFAIAIPIVATGAMHEDGLADCADGFWGGWDPAMRLKIMKDSQIGTYGVLALLMTQTLRFGAILEILRMDNWIIPLIAVHVASRALMPFLMSSLPHARETGLSHSVGKISRKTAQQAACIGVIALLIGFALYGLALAAIGALATYVVARIAKVKVGGQTGDVCGASQQVTEIALLLALLASY